MAEAITLGVNLKASDSGFRKALQDAERAANSFDKKMKDISSSLKNIGGTLSGFGSSLSLGVTAPLTLAGKSMVTAASDFDENLNKVNVAFGNSADSVKSWADTATKNFGLSMNQALEATSLFGDMATSMGLTQPAAASMSTSLAGLAGDLASFKNIEIDQAMTALSGVFTGETESLKQLGIVMTQTNLDAFALANGLGKTTDEMTQAEQVQLRYAYVMEMASNAQGDYARTSDGTANSIRTFQSSVENLAATLGQNLLPIITPLIQKATEMVNAFATADPQLQQLTLKIAGVAAAVGPVLIVLGQFVSSIGSAAGVVGVLGSKLLSIGSLGSTLSAVFAAITGPVGIAVAAITALVAAFSYLMATNEGFRNSVMQTVMTIGESLVPIIQALMPIIQTIATVLASTVLTVVQALAPLLLQIVTMLGQIIATVAPLIEQLISQLTPVLTTIITTVGEIVATVLPPVITVIQSIIEAIEQLLPPIAEVLSTVIEVVSSIIEEVTPIVEFIAETIADIMDKITPIIEFVAGVIEDVMSEIEPIVSFVADVVSDMLDKIEPIASTVGDVFEKVYSTASKMMNKVGRAVTDVFDKIESAWNGLTGFVSGVFSGVESAVQTLVSQVKGFVNGVIGGINAAIGLINMIPGVSIGTIPYLSQGTDNWQGGFAYMNEGGRGELTYLPNGAQVIPHDISVKYAKEAARVNSNAEPIDLNGIMEGMIIQVINNTNVDGTPLKETISDYTIRKIGNQQRARLRSKGVSISNSN